MLTRWGRDLDPERVLAEYPRPQLVRASYLNLNGWWDYAITPASGTGPPATYDGRILVPFSPEAPLSGVDRQLQPDQALWYRRLLQLPDGLALPGGRLLLHFGAVDQSCTVWLGGVEVGAHTGGYLPFTCDITDAWAAWRGGADASAGVEADLVVRVRDVSDNRGPASGKQRLVRGGIWYTAQSGIWQTVWVESVPARYVARLTLVPALEEGALDVVVHVGAASGPSDTDGPARVRVLAGGSPVGEAEAPAGTRVRIPLSQLRPWTPEDPFLYDVDVRLGEDRVTSYFGLRSFGVGPDAAGTPRLLLNGTAYFQRGVLDQGYWPDGLLTPPSDEAMVHDIETVKRLGFTMVRKHLKIEPLRWYHHCDRLGLLVWQDFVNGGERHRTAAVKWPGVLPIRLRDRPRSVLGRSDPVFRAQFEDEVRRTVEHLHNAVSVAVWVPFNEGWGQFDANRVAALVSGLDASRPVDHASGWHDQGGGDVRSLHCYLRRFRVPRRRSRDGRVLALSEYGGYDLRVPGHAWGDVEFGYRRFEDAEALAEAFAALHEHLVLTVARGLAATCYTQLTDVEDELNGLQTYDRATLKLAARVVREAIDDLRL
ncbi:MAG TPA: glycoside hydrolase family 2 TIM barrel-domain containing protein [Nocardioidaceae bacterium]|nr:glycoside hydrolase family 2 TIM barrel-domain containing protein [Nocardioidaceae bacterium]